MMFRKGIAHDKKTQYRENRKHQKQIVPSLIYGHQPPASHKLSEVEDEQQNHTHRDDNKIYYKHHHNYVNEKWAAIHIKEKIEGQDDSDNPQNNTSCDNSLNSTYGLLSHYCFTQPYNSMAKFIPAL